MEYFLVIPNQTYPELSTNFEVFGKVYNARSSNEVLEIADQNGDPFAVVIGMPTENINDRVDFFRKRFPESRIYLAGFVSPFQLGGLDITSILPIPLEESFIKTLKIELSIEEKIGHHLPSSSNYVQNTVNQKPSLSPNGTPVGKDQVIVVFSGKGGEGKTSVSAQLGILLAKKGVSTLLIDADYKGNQSEWFRGMAQPPVKNILNFSDSIPKDRNLLESFLMEKNKLKILPCPAVEVGPIPPETLENAILSYKPYYSTIIIDMHQGFSPELVLASKYANKFVAVTTPSAKRMYPFAVTINQMLNHKIDKRNLHIVVNKTMDESDERSVRTSLEDAVGDSYSIKYHSLPYVNDLMHDDDPEFVGVTDLRNGDPYPAAFLRMAESITGYSLRKEKAEKPQDMSNFSRKEKQQAAKKPSFFSILFGGGNKSKKSKKKPVSKPKNQVKSKSKKKR